jgi:DNA-binding winged helix-turn-helix (wHTH) protein
MDASVDNVRPITPAEPGRFTRVSVETRAGQIEARLSEYGNWDLRVRRTDEDLWKLACAGDLDCGAVTREPVIPIQDRVVHGPLTIEASARQVSVSGNEVVLAQKEYALLLALASRPHRVFTKEELMKSIWGVDDFSKLRTRTLDSHASRLRGKLARAGAAGMIVNTWGVGYRLWDQVLPTPDPTRADTEVSDLAPAS